MNGAEAHVNDRDCYGVTPLYSAAHREAVVVVELLLAHGADPAVHVYGNIRELVEGGHDEVCRQIRERRKGLDVVAQWSWWLKRFVVVQEYDRCLWCNRGYSEEEKEVAMV